ncbi:cation efflux system protein [Bacteroidia bacterium]|nr:cation efflux system protein [Bacteroidia bacterium]
MKHIIFLIALCGLLFVSCRHTHDHDHEAEEAVHSGAITFHDEQQAKIDFAVEMPVIQPFGQVIKTTGQIETAQADEVLLSAKTSGMVVFNTNTTEGQAAKAGQVLFTVSNAGTAENNIKVQFAEAQAHFQKAEADYRRAQELAKDKIVSEKELLETQNAYETAQAVYDNLRKNFSASGQSVTSPVSGYVKQLFVSNGQYVEAGRPLISVSQNKTLLLKADVPVKYAAQLPGIASANIKSMHNPVVYSLAELNGKVLSYGKSLEAGKSMLPVVFQIDNRGSFVPGSFVEVYIQTQSSEPGLTLPSSAIMEEQDNYFVFVQLTPETFEKREVSIGATDGLRTEIRLGLDENERVVTRGAMSVKLAQSAGALDPHAGHVH